MGMQDTVKAIIKRAARNVYEMDLESFIFSHPAQMALLGIQFQWTADMQVRNPCNRPACPERSHDITPSFLFCDLVT